MLVVAILVLTCDNFVCLFCWCGCQGVLCGCQASAHSSACVFRRFEAVVLQGKSPTMEMLFDWGTTDCTVGDLVEILLRHQLLAAVSVLLPDHSSCHASAGAPAHQRFIFIFSIANSLPLSLRFISTESEVKTYLFSQAYSCL